MATGRRAATTPTAVARSPPPTRATRCSSAPGAPSAQLLGADPAGVVLRRQHDDADARLHPRRRRDAAARATASSAPASTTTPTSRRGASPATGRRRARAGPVRPGHRPARSAAVDRPDRRAHPVGGRHRRVEPPRHDRPTWRRSSPPPTTPGARVFVDAVHLAPHRRIDVAALGCDVLVTSPYKWYGPHAGVLCADPALLDELPVAKVRPARRPRAAPVGDRHAELRGDRRRSTPPPSSCSTRASIAIGADEARRRSPRCSTGSARSAACACGDRRRWTTATPTVAFTVDGHHPDEVAAALAPRTDRHVGRPLVRGRGRRPARARRHGRRRARRRRRLRRRRRRRRACSTAVPTPLAADADQADGGVDAGEHARRRASGMTSSAAKFSDTWLGRLAPVITVDTFGFVVHHASASWASEQPSSSAIGRSRSTLRHASLVASGARPASRSRRSAAARVLGDAVAVLAGEQPRRQRAPRSSRRSRCRRTAGRTRPRPAGAASRLYCGCSVTGLCRWWRSAISMRPRISSAAHSLVPQYSALPAATMSLIAHTVSSSVVSGSDRWQ